MRIDSEDFMQLIRACMGPGISLSMGEFAGYVYSQARNSKDGFAFTVTPLVCNKTLSLSEGEHKPDARFWVVGLCSNKTNGNPVISPVDMADVVGKAIGVDMTGFTPMQMMDALEELGKPAVSLILSEYMVDFLQEAMKENTEIQAGFFEMPDNFKH